MRMGKRLVFYPGWRTVFLRSSDALPVRDRGHRVGKAVIRGIGPPHWVGPCLVNRGCWSGIWFMGIKGEVNWNGQRDGIRCQASFEKAHRPADASDASSPVDE